MIQNKPPTPGEVLESVCLIIRGWDEKEIPKLFSFNSHSPSRVRVMAIGVLYYVGGATRLHTGRLLNYKSPDGVNNAIRAYADMPRAVRDPWEDAVRKLAYFWRNDPDSKRHAAAARVTWNRLPEIVKFIVDSRWQRKIVVTGPMIDRLRKITGMSKPYEPPDWDCPMCRKLERRGLLIRRVRHTETRKRAILRYRATVAGRRLLEQLDATQPQRSPAHDPAGNLSDTVPPH